MSRFMMRMLSSIGGLVSYAVFGGPVCAQGLSLELVTQNGATATFAVRYDGGASEVTALQFDLSWNPAVLDGASLKAARGKDLAQAFQLEARQVQSGTVRALIIPPIRADLPAIPSGEIAVLSFSLKAGAAVTSQAIDFVRRAVVFSDRQGRSVAVRSLQNNIARQLRVPK